MKKAKIILLTVLVMAVVCFSGCNQMTKKSNDAPTHEMTVVDETTGYTIYKHDVTGVYYFCRDGGTYGRSVCVMVNADGTPYTGGNTDEK